MTIEDLVREYANSEAVSKAEVSSDEDVRRVMEQAFRAGAWAERKRSIQQYVDSCRVSWQKCDVWYHGKGRRHGKLCQCSECGIIERVTQERDFYRIAAGGPTPTIVCTDCFARLQRPRIT
jgi:hypothetical protein